MWYGWCRKKKCRRHCPIRRLRCLCRHYRSRGPRLLRRLRHDFVVFVVIVGVFVFVFFVRRLSLYFVALFVVTVVIVASSP